jgi:ABC-2 type transport system permease protein
MRSFLVLIRKHLYDTRGTLLLSAAALFGLGWLFVFVTSLNETEILEMLNSEAAEGRFRWMRGLGIEREEPASVTIMMAFWSHPFILLTISIWAIARGSAAVGAEVERGTLDLILSRPIRRSEYLASQVLVALLGLLLLPLALTAGAAAATRFNVLRVPPSFWTLIHPAVGLSALGLPIYGYTLVVSAVDHVRWRATMVGSVLTLIGFIAWVVSVIPVLQKYTWRVYLERISLFKLYNPVDAVTAAESLAFNVGVLTSIGAACIALAFLGFLRRDLPTNG